MLKKKKLGKKLCPSSTEAEIASYPRPTTWAPTYRVHKTADEESQIVLENNRPSTPSALAVPRGLVPGTSTPDTNSATGMLLLSNGRLSADNLCASYCRLPVTSRLLKCSIQDGTDVIRPRCQGCTRPHGHTFPSSRIFSLKWVGSKSVCQSQIWRADCAGLIALGCL